MVWIGLSGKKESGKTTVTRTIQEARPWFEERTFAGPLKEIVKIAFNWEDKNLIDGPDKETVDPRWGFAPRFPLQHMGTEYFRNTYDKWFWIKNLKHRLEKDNPTDLIISDVRFPEEIEFIRSSGGQVWRIDRPGHVNKDQHASETALDNRTDWDYLIVNDGSLEELKNKILGKLEEIDPVEQDPDEAKWL
jgi:hypothetical protein